MYYVIYVTVFTCVYRMFTVFTACYRMLPRASATDTATLTPLHWHRADTPLHRTNFNNRSCDRGLKHRFHTAWPSSGVRVPHGYPVYTPP